jgi:hypothetical protein
MNAVPPAETHPTPNAEWHGGVAEHALEARGVSQGVKNDSGKLTRQASHSSVLIWFALWMLPLLPGLSGYVLTADDLGAYHFPLRSYYQSALQAGENWTWCPWIFGGYHLHGEGQIGGDHPLHQLLYRVLPLHWAFGLECWWAYPATFFGMWWWLRQLRFSTAASQVGALVFSLCGYMTLRVVHVNAIQVIAHVPWLLGCLTWVEHRARRSTTWRSLLPPMACSALLTGSQLLLGYPQYVVFTLIAEGLWLVSLMIRSPKARCTLAMCWLTAKCFGLLLGASQILPTLEYLSLSERMNWTSSQMFEGSWPLLNLTQLVAPYLFANRVVGQNTHELTIFVGLVPVSLALLGLANRPHRSLRAVQAFAVMLCAVGLVLALGDMSPLADVMPYVPVWNRFRFPCRATLLICLGVALLAALGCERLFVLARNSSVANFSSLERHWLHGLLAVSILVPLYSAIAWKEHLGAWPYILIGPLAMLATWGIFYKMLTRRVKRQLLLITIGTELVLYAATHHHFQEATNLPRNIDHNQIPAATVSQPGLERQNIAVDASPRSNMNLAPHLLRSDSNTGKRLEPFAQINGYAGVLPRRQLTYDLEHPGALAAAGVTRQYMLCDQGQITTTSPIQQPALARGTLLTKTEPAIQPARRIEQIDLQQVALVAEYLGLSPEAADDRLQLGVTVDRPGHLEITLDTNRDALLVTTENFHPGWHARVDGIEVPVLRVNGDFLGVRVPSAALRVECYFSDNWHTVGRWISLSSLGLLGVVLCLTCIRQNAPGFVR